MALDQIVATYGYAAIALLIAAESMGVPAPGETTLVLAAMYAATHSGMDIRWVIATAVAAAIAGDNAGYWLGSRFGYPLLRRFGHRIGMSDDRIRVGQYLFHRYGAAVVFLGRFVALLRAFAAFFAGVNRMPWPRFLAANAAGAVVWAMVFGLASYYFGKAFLQVKGDLGPLVIIGALLGFIGVGLLIRRFEDRLIEKAAALAPEPVTARAVAGGREPAVAAPRKEAAGKPARTRGRSGSKPAQRKPRSSKRAKKRKRKGRRSKGARRRK